MATLMLVGASLGVDAMSSPDPSGSESRGQARGTSNPIVRLLASGKAVFGIFSGEKTAEQGARMAANRETDFVFYSLETGPFDMPSLQRYARAMADASGEGGTHPIVLRIPPVRNGRDAAREHVRQGLAADVQTLVIPHVETAEEAAFVVDALGVRPWPLDPDGDIVAMLLIEDRTAVANAREIVNTPGVGIVVPGPGDLRRAYERNAQAVEDAIQAVLAACLEFDVPCGITAGADDIAERLTQGFRVIIVTQPEALAVGRQAAGR